MKRKLPDKSVIGSMFFLMLLIATSQPCFAEESSTEHQRARELFEQGMSLVEMERWAEALERFDESLSIYPTRTALFNRAMCLELLHRPVEGAEALETFLERYSDEITEEERAEVERNLAALRGQSGTINISPTGEDGVEVFLDGNSLGQAPLERPVSVNPGAHEVLLTGRGIEDQRRSIHVGEGQVVNVSFGLEGDEQSESAPVAVGEEPSRGPRLLIGGGVSAGVALAALGTSLALLIWNNSRYPSWVTERDALVTAYSSTETTPADPNSLGSRLETNDELASSIKAVDIVSWVLFGVGVAAITASIPLFVIGARQRRARVSPLPGGLALNVIY